MPTTVQPLGLPEMLEFTLLLIVLIPSAWLASEFQTRTWIRVLLGGSAIALSFLVTYTVGSLERLNSNAWYGAASNQLIDSTINALEKGNTEQVIEELKLLQSKFQPTYENRARYDHLVEEYRTRVDDERKNLE